MTLLRLLTILRNRLKDRDYIAFGNNEELVDYLNFGAAFYSEEAGIVHRRSTVSLATDTRRYDITSQNFISINQIIYHPATSSDLEDSMLDPYTIETLDDEDVTWRTSDSDYPTKYILFSGRHGTEATTWGYIEELIVEPPPDATHAATNHELYLYGLAHGEDQDVATLTATVLAATIALPHRYAQALIDYAVWYITGDDRMRMEVENHKTRMLRWTQRMPFDRKPYAKPDVGWYGNSEIYG